eukprot:jgi/Galph1/2267/GphlegSOOS_G944.1
MDNLRLQEDFADFGRIQKPKLFADAGVKRKSFDTFDRRSSDLYETKFDESASRRSYLLAHGSKISSNSTNIGYQISSRNRASSFHGYISDAYQQAIASAKRDHWKILVIKATSHELTAPKEKHVFQLIQGSHWGGSIENREAPCGSLYRQLGKRLLSEDWVVVLKALIVFHRIFREGSDAFTKEVSRSASGIFNLQGFRDSSNEGWCHVPYIRNYGRYIEHWCRTKANINFPEGPVYTDIPQVELDAETFSTQMRRSSALYNTKKNKFVSGPHRYKECPVEQLLEELPWLLSALEYLVFCELHGNIKRCPVALSAFSLILADSYRLWNAISDGLENLIENYFFMEYENAKVAIELYGRFLKLLSQIRAFFESAKTINSKIRVPNINRIPTNILGEMERYLRRAFLGKNQYTASTNRASRKKMLDSYPGMELPPIPIPNMQFRHSTTISSTDKLKQRFSTMPDGFDHEEERVDRYRSASVHASSKKYGGYYVDTSPSNDHLELNQTLRRSKSEPLHTMYFNPSAPSERSSSPSHQSLCRISSLRYPNRFLHRQENSTVLGSPSSSSASRFRRNSSVSMQHIDPRWSLYSKPQDEAWIYNPRRYHYQEDSAQVVGGYTISSSPRTGARHLRRTYSLPSAQQEKFGFS